MIPAPYIYAAIAVAGFAGGWAANGWRLGEELAELQGDLRHERSQVQVLAGGLEACNAGVDLARAAGDQVRGLKAELLAEVRKANAPKEATVQRLEALLRQPPPVRADGKAAGCDDAWDKIEADRKARGPQ